MRFKVREFNPKKAISRHSFVLFMMHVLRGRDWPGVGLALKGPPLQRSGWDRVVGRGLFWSLFPQMQDSCAVPVISVHPHGKGLQRHISPSLYFEKLIKTEVRVPATSCFNL